MTCFRCLLLLLIAILYAGYPARADSWLSPFKAVYLSTDKNVRLTVEPCKPTRKGSYNCAGGVETRANGILEQKTKSGGWVKLWHQALVNEVAPTGALVSRSGQYVVTFDNWYGTGTGKNVVVIYNAQGSLIRSFALSDIVSENYIEAMPHSVSSIQWHGEHKLTSLEDQLVLQVVIPVAQPTEDGYLDNDGYVDIHIDLATGQLVPPSGPEWQRALQAVATVNAVQLAWQQERRRYLTDPLLGPMSREETELHAYLREAFSRLTLNWQEDYTSTTVLRLPTAKDYAPSEKWVKDALLEDWAGNVSIASQSAHHFLIVLRKVVGQLKQDRLKELTVYVMASDKHWLDIEQIFAKSGAKLVQLNPEKPIAQSPDRLAKLVDIAEQ